MKINDVSDHMSTLIDRLLLLSRYDSDSIQNNNDVVDLAELSQDCINLIEPLANEKNLSLSFTGSEALILADQLRITEVLLNLLSNALNHTEQGTISISVETADHSHTLTVSDTGCGIAEEHLDAIFERFYKVDSSRGQQTKNNGLGLAICKSIIKECGGSITVKSEVGSGTSFIIRLAEIDNTVTV